MQIITPQGTPVAKITLATNERFKGKDGQWQDRTEWHNVVLWQRLAEIAGEYLKKGGKVTVIDFPKSEQDKFAELYALPVMDKWVKDGK